MERVSNVYYHVNGSVSHVLRRGHVQPNCGPGASLRPDCAYGSSGSGDMLVLYSAGPIDVRPDRALGPATLDGYLDGATSAREIADRVVDLVVTTTPPPDDLTVVALRCMDV